MRYVPYIEKTHAYYRRKGYDEPYRYAENDTGVFTPLRRPLAESRLVLISSAGIEIVPDDGPAPQPYPSRNIGDKTKAEVTGIPSDLPADKLVYVTGAHNHQESDMRDPDAFFPATRLRELAGEGRIGSLAPEHLRMRPAYSQRKTRELDAPEVLRRCREQAVDVALLVPI